MTLGVSGRSVVTWLIESKAKSDRDARILDLAESGMTQEQISADVGWKAIARPGFGRGLCRSALLRRRRFYLVGAFGGLISYSFFWVFLSMKVNTNQCRENRDHLSKARDWLPCGDEVGSASNSENSNQ